MAKLTPELEVQRISSLIDSLNNVNFDEFSKKERKQFASSLKMLDIFLKKYAVKAAKVQVKNPQKILEDKNFGELYRNLENAAAFFVDYYLIACDGKQSLPAVKYAEIGEKLCNPHCLVALSYMYSKGKCGLIPNSKKARALLEKAVEWGGIDDTNFEVAKEAVLAAERMAAGFRAAALADRQNSGGGVLEALSGFSDWLNDYTEKQEAQKAIERQCDRKGVVVEEQYSWGKQYVFYAEDDPGHTRGERLKNFDALTRTGETENGGKVKGE